jgi:hypothetical protein
MLWGGHAQAKAELIESAANQTAPDFLGLRGGSVAREALVLKANHPSPHTARHADLPPPRTFPCLRGDTTTEQRLVRGVRDTLTELWGAATAGRVERAVTRWARSA